MYYGGTSMSLETYRPRYRPARKPLVTVDLGGFRFSSAAAKLASLRSVHWVRISTDESERLIGFEFLDDPIQPEDTNKLMRYKGRSRGCRARGLMKSAPWINAVAKRKCKFELFPYPRNTKIWVIRLAPWFELSCRPKEISQIGTAAGIYRYRNSRNKVIYIGKGRIADRFREPDRRTWRIERIEYSMVPNDEQHQWEKFHLDLFVKENNGHLPQFNRVAGHL